MAARERRRGRGWSRRAAVVALGLPCIAGVVGCASAPARQPVAAKPPVTAPQTVTLAPAPTPKHVEEPVAAAVRSNEPVVIDEGIESPSGARELAAVAAAERERRRLAGPRTVVITNANLAEHATGKLTITQGSPAPAAASAAPGAAASAKDERYWRDLVHGLREQWAAAVDSIGELEARAASLRTRFYAQDDPYVRDGEIKPAWDRTLENLDQARGQARSLEDRLGATLEEGRQAGALPGWLRDGIELEPSERPYDPPDRQVARDDVNLVREPDELGEPPN